MRSIGFAPALRGLVAAAGCATLLGSLPVPSARADLTAPYVQTGSQPAAPGVVHRWGTAASDLGPEVVHIARVDPTQAGIHFRTNLPNGMVNGRETTTSQALSYSGEGHRVVAAINGPTFASYPGTHYSARGLNVADREITSANPRSEGLLTAFAVDSSGAPRIGTPALSVTVSLPGGAQGSVDRINGGRMPGETVIFTPRFDSHTWTDSTGDEYVIDGLSLPLQVSGTWTGMVTSIRRGAGDSPIGTGQVVLSSSGDDLALYRGLAIGDAVTIDIGITAGWEDTVQAIGAKEIIVSNGTVDMRPYDADDLTVAHPRSAIGITAAGKVIMVAVEGRAAASAGLRLEDLARLMLSLGAVDALNFDGGGSTTLAIRRPGDFEVSVVNALSGGGTTLPGTERTVSNSLQVVSDFATGALTKLVVSPVSATLAVGQSERFTAKAHDAYYNGVVPGPATWSVSGGASVDGSGLVGAQALGDFMVTAKANGLTASAAFSVVVPPKPLVPTGMIATAAPGRVVNVAWNPSSTPIPGGLTYRLFRDGVAIGIRQSALTYTDTPTAGVHKYQVRAIDAVGTRSDMSVPVAVQVYDTAPPPTVPAGLVATPGPALVVNLSWNASAAYVPGTVTYRVFRDGTAVGLQTANLTFTDQPAAGTHKYQVRAIDAAGTRSALSPAVTVIASP